MSAIDDEIEIMELEIEIAEMEKQQTKPLSPVEKIRGARSEIMNTAFFGQVDPLVDAITGQPGQSKLGRQEFRARASQSPSLLTRQLPPLMSSTGAMVNPPFMKLAAPWVRGAQSVPSKMFRGATTGGLQAGLQALGERQPAGEVKKEGRVWRTWRWPYASDLLGA